MQKAAIASNMNRCYQKVQTNRPEERHAPGSVSLRIILKASMKEPGQPWENMRGMALGSEERSCTKCSCREASDRFPRISLGSDDTLYAIDAKEG